MFTHLKNILATIMLMFHSSAGFIVDYVLPSIKVIETVKFAFNLNKIQLAKFDIYKYLIETFNLNVSFVNQLVAAFVNEVKNLVPDIDKNFTDAQKEDYQNCILVAFITYIKTIEKWQKDMFYLRLAGTILIKIAALDNHELKDNDALTLIQVAYSNHKLTQSF